MRLFPEQNILGLEQQVRKVLLVVVIFFVVVQHGGEGEKNQEPSRTVSGKTQRY